MGMATDNAANNDTMLQRLDLLLPEGAHLSSNTRTRCFAHTLNLVVGVRKSQALQCNVLTTITGN
jgi:hypothetical protein